VDKRIDNPEFQAAVADAGVKFVYFQRFRKNGDVSFAREMYLQFYTLDMKILHLL
jgi:hypothetical protein